MRFVEAFLLSSLTSPVRAQDLGESPLDLAIAMALPGRFGAVRRVRHWHSIARPAFDAQFDPNRMRKRRGALVSVDKGD